VAVNGEELNRLHMDIAGGFFYRFLSGEKIFLNGFSVGIGITMKRVCKLIVDIMKEV
jgi:hypothetical protein